MNSSAKNGEITRETLQIREGRRELIRISLIRLSLLSPPNLLPRSTQLKPSTLRPSLRPISFPTYYVSPDAHPFSVHVGRRHVTRKWANRVSARTGCGRKGTRVRQAKNIFAFGTRQIYVSSVLATNYIFSTVMATCVRSVCVCVCVQNHSSSLWLGRASRALYTIIVKNFRKIVSRNTCSFLEMLGRVEDPCAFASRIPTESEFRWIFFFFFARNPCGKRVSSSSLPTEPRRIRDILKYRYNRALVLNSRYTREISLILETGVNEWKSYLAADFKFKTYFRRIVRGNIRIYGIYRWKI